MDNLKAFLEEKGFDGNDPYLVEKFLKLQSSLLKCGWEEEEAAELIIRTISKKDKRSKVIAGIFAQSRLESDYFDVFEKLHIMKRQLSEFGFNRAAFKALIRKKPESMFINLNGLRDKVKYMHEKYGEYGFTGNDFLHAGCKDPSLLKNSVDTIDNKVRENLTFLKDMGVLPEIFFKGVKVQAQLLSIKPENVASRAKLLLVHHRLGFWSFSGMKEDISDAEILSQIFLQRPMAFNLSDKNLKMRKVYALTSSSYKEPAYMKLGTYLASREDVEKKMTKDLVVRYPSLYDRMLRLGYLSAKQNGKE